MARPVKSYAEMVQEAKTRMAATQPEALKARMESGEKMVLIDVREPAEHAQGVLPGAHPIPRGVLEGQVDSRIPRDATVVLYCGGGGRSALAGRNLVEMGYEKVENLEGGFSGWAQRGFPVEKPHQ